MKGYVINLKKREDRLRRFQENIQKNLQQILPILIEVVEAIDGETINIANNFFQKNVNKWNFEFLPDKNLRGVVACCLSHLKVYNKIMNDTEPYAYVFEDDCIIKEVGNLSNLTNLILPEKFGIIFMNEWGKLETQDCDYENLEFISSGFQTAEAYIISKEYAKIMFQENMKNIGAIDAHMVELRKKYPEYPYYTLKNTLFIQYDRNDSNIR